MRRQTVAAALTGFGLAAAIILASSRGDVDRMTYGDGLIYRYVAAHFAQDPEDVAPVVVERGTSLRYGRVGLPALIWFGSLGRPSAMPYVQPIVIAIGAGAAAAAAIRLVPGLGALGFVVPFVAPGFALAVAGGFAEAVAVPFALWAVVNARSERWGWAMLCLAAGLLTRENSGAVLVGIAVWLVLHRRVSKAGVLALALAPMLLWYAFVAARYGHVPILDPYLRVTTDTIAAPGVAIWRSLTGSSSGGAITAALHLGIAVLAFAMWRRSMVWTIAAAAGLQVFAAGPFSFAFEGEAVRQFVFLQLFVLLGVVSIRWGRMGTSPPSHSVTR